MKLLLRRAWECNVRARVVEHELVIRHRDPPAANPEKPADLEDGEQGLLLVDNDVVDRTDFCSLVVLHVRTNQFTGAIARRYDGHIDFQQLHRRAWAGRKVPEKTASANIVSAAIARAVASLPFIAAARGRRGGRIISLFQVTISSCSLLHDLTRRVACVGIIGAGARFIDRRSPE